jgi:eukaryotic-like serine/threonine-protein kinase
MYAGVPATIASDQFSFCIATYEALYGARPFAGGTLDELRARMASGEIKDVQGSQIPPRIRAALLRGLSPDPAKRFPSMEALLDALDEPARKLPRLVLALAALAIAGVVAFLLLRGTTASCEIDDTAIAWDRDGITRALASTIDGPKVIASIERYQRDWLGARRKACEATRIRKELSERVLDARNACLDRGRRELVELAALLVRDPSLSSRGVEAVGRLQDPQACTPDVGEVRHDPDVDRAFALLAAGRSQDAIDVAAKVLERPSLAPVIRAQALLARGRGEGILEHFEVSDKLLNDAIPLAEEARAINIVAHIWVELVSITGAQNHKFDAAQAYMRGAEAAFRRADPGPALRAHYEYVVGAMLLARGSHEEAKTYFERSLVALGAAYPGDRASVHAALCDLYRQKRDIPNAREQCKRAEGLMSEAYGPDHQKLGVLYNVWGTVELADKQRPAAREKWARAIAIFEKRKLEHDRGYALALSNTGVSYSEEGDLDKARPLFEKARDLFAKYHPNHVQRTLPLQGLAGVALRQNDFRAAIAAYEESLGVIETVYGKEDERRITVLYNLTLAYERLPDLAKAREFTDEIVRLCQHPGRENWLMLAYALDRQALIIEQESKNWALGIETRKRALAALDRKNDPSVRAWIELEIGRVMRNAGKLADSIPYLEKARAFYIQPNAMPDRYEAGTSQFWLAKSLWETGRDKRRAVTLANAALVELESTKAGMNIEKHRAQVTEWLAKHR